METIVRLEAANLSSAIANEIPELLAMRKANEHSKSIFIFAEQPNDGCRAFPSNKGSEKRREKTE